ncbi:hypothetical protein [Cylindrospermopsis raciborskii]|uniref:hypothetical protein n=1 Tax=Cylindrospermopsis raciborskii TaxID=77022 RepID=UPI0038D1B080
MWKNCLSTISSVMLVLGCFYTNQQQAIAQAVIEQDSLNITKGIPWGAGGFPFSQVANIKDSLVDIISGKVVIDRHGEPDSGLSGPFSQPFPGRFVIVSLWGSNVDGCFLQVVVQKSPNDGQAELQQLVPKTLEIGVNNQIIELERNPSTQVRGFKVPYNYTRAQGTSVNSLIGNLLFPNSSNQPAENSNKQISSNWYMATTLFAVDQGTANFLRSAQPREIRIRLKFENGDARIVRIGKGTVEKWPEVYGFNSKCVPQ